MRARQAVVLIQVKGDDLLETQAFLAVQPDQLPVKPDGRGARGEPEHRRPAGGGILAHKRRDLAGDQPAGIVRFRVNDCPDMFALLGFGRVGIHVA